MLLTRWLTGFTTSPRGTVTRPGGPNAPVRSAPSCAGDRVGPPPTSEEKPEGTRMINWGDVAALVAAFFFAVLICAAVYVLIRLARLLTDTRARSDSVFERAQAAVDRAHEQLDATGTVAAGMDELNTGMSQLGAQVSALAGLGRAVATGPVGRAAAFVYGVKHAVGLRRDGRAVPAHAIASKSSRPDADPAELSAAGSAGGRR